MWAAIRKEAPCGPAGEDEDMKRMMWVVENLQEELMAADSARMAADELVRARHAVVQGLQVCAETLTYPSNPCVLA